MTVQKYFEDRAAIFDSLYGESNALTRWFNQTFRAALYQRVRFTVDEMSAMRDFSVLDVGCGSGRNSILFVRAGARKVVGVDFSAPMLQLAREYSQRNGVQDACTFVQADFMNHEFGESFDVVCALGVFDYIADPVPFLKRMAGLSNGKVIASFPMRSLLRAPIRKLRYSLRNCPLYFYTEEKLTRAAREAGLTDVALVPMASSGRLLVGRPSR